MKGGTQLTNKVARGRWEMTEAEFKVEDTECIWNENASVSLFRKWLDKLERQEFDAIPKVSQWRKPQLPTIMIILWSVTKAGDFGLWNNACFAEQVVEA